MSLLAEATPKSVLDWNTLHRSLRSRKCRGIGEACISSKSEMIFRETNPIGLRNDTPLGIRVRPDNAKFPARGPKSFKTFSAEPPAVLSVHCMDRNLGLLAHLAPCGAAPGHGKRRHRAEEKADTEEDRSPAHHIGCIGYAGIRGGAFPRL